MNIKRLLFFTSIVFTLTILTQTAAAEEFKNVHQVATQSSLERFELILETFQRDLKLPGISVVILKDQEVIWAKGFGYIDIEGKIRATPNTPYHLASVTKPIGSVILLQLVEQGIIDLEESFVKYGMDLDSTGIISLKHLFTHTSEGIPGTSYNYNGNRYGYLGIAVKKASGKSFRTLVIENILMPLEMTNTAPNMADPEVLNRFFTYMNESAIDAPILNEQNEPYNIISLYDYLNPEYGKSYAVATNLIASALNQSGINSEFFHYSKKRVIDEATRNKFHAFWEDNYQFVDVYKKLTKPYMLDSSLNIVLGKYSMFFNPAAGFISSALDMAKFDIALDKDLLISEKTKRIAFTPTRSPTGEIFPYGLGWFTQKHEGVQIVWHGGEWYSASALYLKVPDENRTLIIMANSRKMSEAFSMGSGDVLESGIGLAFLRLFVFENKFGVKSPDINWNVEPQKIVQQIDQIENEKMKDLYIREMRVMETMFMRMGQEKLFKQIVSGVRPHVMQVFCPKYDLPVLAEIMEVGDDEHRTQDFTLEEDKDVRIYAIGEITENGAWDHGWIENLVTNDVAWQMEYSNTDHAGGALKNRKVDRVIFLEADRYRLHFKTDIGHSFNNWNAAVPDHLFWGIRIYEEQ